MAKSKKLVFNVEKYLETAGLARKVLEYRKRQTIFAQGSACKSVLYLQRGRVKLTVTSAVGKEAVIAILTDGDFFGEGSIAGQPLRIATAVAMEPTSVLEIGTQEMIRVIHNEPRFSETASSHTCSNATSELKKT